MDLQSQFNITHNLLLQSASVPFVTETIDVLLDRIWFDPGEQPADWNRTDTILSLYELRYKIAKGNPNEKMDDWEILLGGLRKTKSAHVRISSIVSAHKSFLIFSDFDGKELIGILAGETGFVEIISDADENKSLNPYEVNERQIFVGGLLEGG
jgi:hypothetical protein